MTEDESTVYSATITTPAGITYSTSVVVPAEAEYDEQHELTETVQAGVARMIGMDARRREPLHNTWCAAVLATEDGQEHRCDLPEHPNLGPHRARRPDRVPVYWNDGLATPDRCSSRWIFENLGKRCAENVGHDGDHRNGPFVWSPC